MINRSITLQNLDLEIKPLTFGIESDHALNEYVSSIEGSIRRDLENALPIDPRWDNENLFSKIDQKIPLISTSHLDQQSSFFSLSIILH
ncbi:unnamed protein product, partial [marine sediment metagenome]